MAKYSREQRDRAVDLYIKYERCAADVIRELGYPSKGVLLSWYADRLEEERTGVPSGRGERYRRYTDGQKRATGGPLPRKYGRRLSRTMRMLGYRKQGTAHGVDQTSSRPANWDEGRSGPPRAETRRWSRSRRTAEIA